MANKGYPDNDGTRTPSGPHDEGRQRVSICDVHSTTVAQNIAEMRGGDRVNGWTDLDGMDCPTTYRGLVDGDSNSDGDYNPAAYPASNSMA